MNGQGNQNQILACNSSYKCEMRKLLVKLAKERKASGEAWGGSLGPAKFEPIQSFLERTVGSISSKEQKPQPVVYDRKQHPRVLAVGDVHSDLLALLSALRLGGVIDATANWIGSDTLVVQTGDLVDRSGRGRDSIDTAHNACEEIDILQYIHALNEQARANGGGGFVSVTGNHESEQFSYQPGDSEWNAITPYEGGEAHIACWGGLKAKRELFQPGTLLAKYFEIYKPVLLQVDNFLFCHGGVPLAKSSWIPWPKEKRRSVEEINRKWREFLAKGKQGSSPPDEVNSIYWSREWSSPDDKNYRHDENECARAIAQLFKEFNLIEERAGLVVSHTVQDNGIELYCKGKVWRIDVGLSEAFGSSRPLEVLLIFFDDPDVKVQVIKAQVLERSKAVQTGSQVKTYVRGVLQSVENLEKFVRKS